MGHVGIPEFLEQKWTRHAEGGARRTPNPVPQIAQKLSFGGSWDTVDRSGRRVPGSHLSWWRTDCVAEDAVSCEPVSALNSLLTRKITGNFAESGLPVRFSRPVGQWISKASSRIPYATKQGIFERVSGNFSRGTGKFSEANAGSRVAQVTGNAVSCALARRR